MADVIRNEFGSRRVLSGHNVLVVENEYYLAEDLARAVRCCGGAVVGPVATADEAIHLLETKPVSFAILDIALDGHLVYPVADQLMDADIPVVFATGLPNEMIPAPYRHIPCWVKPYLSISLVAGSLHLLQPRHCET